MIPLPGTSPADDAYIAAVNGLIAAFNQLTADFNANVPTSQLESDIMAEGAAMELLAILTDARPQGSQTFTQADFDAAFASIRSSGLPTVEVAYLTSAGWSSSDIATLASYVGNLPFVLAVPSVTTSDLTHGLANAFGVPGPSSLLLLGSGSLAMLGSVLQQRVRSSLSALNRRRCGSAVETMVVPSTWSRAASASRRARSHRPTSSAGRR